jgi:hypothetical protein
VAAVRNVGGQKQALPTRCCMKGVLSEAGEAPTEACTRPLKGNKDVEDAWACILLGGTRRRLRETDVERFAGRAAHCDVRRVP